MWGRELVRRSGATAAAASAVTVDAAKGSVPRATISPSAASARREVVILLEELGLAPGPDARAGVVKLRRCPLLEAAHQYPEVVCGVHLGVVRGALDELGTDPDRVERTTLQPFAEPGACRLDLLPHRGTTT
jgi:predicted ArsR family transcriptional regulator